MRINYLYHLANIIDIQWSRPDGGGGGGGVGGLAGAQLPIELVNS